MTTQSQLKFDTEFFCNFTWTRNVVKIIFRKSKLWNFRLLNSHHLQKEGKRIESILFINTSAKEDRDSGSAFEELPSRLLSTSFVLSSIDESLSVPFSRLSPSSSRTSGTPERGNLGDDFYYVLLLLWFIFIKWLNSILILCHFCSLNEYNVFQAFLLFWCCC